MSNRIDLEWTLLLDCLHQFVTDHDRIRTGDTVDCTDCNTKCEVIRVIEPDWEWLLTCKQCPRLRRRTGQSERLAWFFGKQHRDRYGQDHQLRVEKEFKA